MLYIGNKTGRSQAAREYYIYLPGTSLNEATSARWLSILLTATSVV